MIFPEKSPRHHQRGFAVAEMLGIVLTLYVFLSGDSQGKEKLTEGESKD